MTNQKNTLQLYVEEKLSTRAFAELKTNLYKAGMTKARLSRIMNKPAKASIADIKKFSACSSIPLNELVIQYKMGYETLTMSDCDQLLFT